MGHNLDLFINGTKNNFMVVNAINKPEFINNRMHGALCLILHKYNKYGSPLNNRICGVFGKEKAGLNANKFNLFGGKVEDHNSDKVTSALKTLYNEIYEELGIILTADLFNKALINVDCVHFNNGFSVIFYLHIIGIKRSWWNNLQICRHNKNNHLKWKYQEISEITHIPLDDDSLYQRSDISSIIRSNLDYIRRSISYFSQNYNLLITTDKYVRISEFRDAIICK